MHQQDASRNKRASSEERIKRLKKVLHSLATIVPVISLERVELLYPSLKYSMTVSTKNSRHHDTSLIGKPDLKYCTKCRGTFYKSSFDTHRCKIFRCSVCNKEFMFNCYLKRHMATHIRKALVCNLNDETLTYEESHSKQNKDRNMKCGFCGRLFTRRSALTNHQRVHYAKKKCFLPRSNVEKCSTINTADSVSYRQDFQATEEKLVNISGIDTIMKLGTVQGQQVFEKELQQTEPHSNKIIDIICEYCGRVFRKKHAHTNHLRSHYATKRRRVNSRTGSKKRFKINGNDSANFQQDCKVIEKNLNEICETSGQEHRVLETRAQQMVTCEKTNENNLIIGRDKKQKCQILENTFQQTLPCNITNASNQVINKDTKQGLGKRFQKVAPCDRISETNQVIDKDTEQEHQDLGKRFQKVVSCDRISETNQVIDKDTEQEHQDPDKISQKIAPYDDDQTNDVTAEDTEQDHQDVGKRLQQTVPCGKFNETNQVTVKDTEQDSRVLDKRFQQTAPCGKINETNQVTVKDTEQNHQVVDKRLQQMEPRDKINKNNEVNDNGIEKEHQILEKGFQQTIPCDKVSERDKIGSLDQIVKKNYVDEMKNNSEQKAPILQINSASSVSEA